ncbi:MAG: ATP synthase F0 subunit A [Bdellovibrionales bacterium RIFOXYD1_FULL_53_11]|nr:MAG: ATP synthase F0 subunit A [Bdellovibrionales bacterium RIFOXYD1_FULL_53_11]
MQAAHSFNWLSLIPGLDHAPNHVVMGAAVAGALVVATAVARTQLVRAQKSEHGGIIPEARLSFRNFFEIIAEAIFRLTENVIGKHDAPRFFPVIGTLFVFILSANLVGMIPGFLPPTDNLNTTLALGTFVFIYYNYAGFRAHGFAYLKHFLGPVLWLAPLLLFIELATHVFRPISLALRLRGNIMGDHVVLGVFSSLVPYLLPVVFYGLGLFVAFVQAFVFCLMTMVYISLSTSHDH